MNKNVSSMATTTLMLLAFITVGLIMLPNIWTFVVVSLAVIFAKPNTDDKIPLLSAMNIESNQNPTAEWSASPAVLRFIPIGTQKTKVLTLLEQNEFKYQTTHSSKSSEAIYAHLHRDGAICATNYTILLELKNNLTTDIKAGVEHICL